MAARVQTNIKALVAGTAGVGPYTITFTSAVVAGDLLVLCLGHYTTSTPTITDTQGNTYVQRGSTLTSATYLHKTYSCVAKSSSAANGNVVTIHFSVNVTYATAAIAEYSGVDTYETGAQAGATSTGPANSGNFTTTHANEVLIGWLSNDTGGTATFTATGSGWARQQEVTPTGTWALTDNVNAAAGTYSASATIGGGTSTDWLSQASSFYSSVGIQVGVASLAATAGLTTANELVTEVASVTEAATAGLTASGSFFTPGEISHVQDAVSANVTASTTTTSTFPTATTVGNFLVFVCTSNGPSGLTVSGGGVGTWVHSASGANLGGTGQSCDVWTGFVTSSGQTVVTITDLSGANFPAGCGSEFSNVDTTTPVATHASPFSTSNVSSLTLTSEVLTAGQCYYGGGYHGDGIASPYTASSGFTTAAHAEQSTGGVAFDISGYRIVTTGATIQLSFTAAGSNPFVGGLVVLNPVPGGAATEFGTVNMAGTAGLVTANELVTEIASVVQLASTTGIYVGSVVELASVTEAASASLTTVNELVIEKAVTTEAATAGMTVTSSVTEVASLTESAITSLAVIAGAIFGTNYGGSTLDLADGAGAWVNPPNAIGPPDSSYSSWTAP